MRVKAQESMMMSATPTEERQEFEALISGCGVYPIDRGYVVLRGSDRVRWLNGMITNNVRDLVPGHGVYAFLLNPQGKIQADLYAFNRGDTLIVTADRSQVETILQIFERYIIMDDVEMENNTGKFDTLGIAGPKSAEILMALDFQQQLASLEFASWNFRGMGLTVVRCDNPCLPNFELWLDPAHASPIFQVLLECGAVRVGNAMLETLRIACGIPKFGRDIRERDLPQETAQDRALNFNKGCYIGQEIVERVRSRGAVHRTLVGFRAASMLSPGARIQNEGKDVGEITSVAAVPAGPQGQVLALGSIRKEFVNSGNVLTVGDLQITPVPLPFRFCNPSS